MSISKGLQLFIMGADSAVDDTLDPLVAAWLAKGEQEGYTPIPSEQIPLLNTLMKRLRANGDFITKCFKFHIGVHNGDERYMQLNIMNPELYNFVLNGSPTNPWIPNNGYKGNGTGILNHQTSALSFIDSGLVDYNDASLFGVTFDYIGSNYCLWGATSSTSTRYYIRAGTQLDRIQGGWSMLGPLSGQPVVPTSGDMIEFAVNPLNDTMYYRLNGDVRASIPHVVDTIGAGSTMASFKYGAAIYSSTGISFLGIAKFLTDAESSEASAAMKDYTNAIQAL